MWDNMWGRGLGLDAWGRYVGQSMGQGVQMRGAIYGAGGRQCVGLTLGQGGAEPQQRHQVCHIAVQTASNAGVLRGGEKVGGDGGRYGAGGGQ